MGARCVRDGGAGGGCDRCRPGELRRLLPRTEGTFGARAWAARASSPTTGGALVCSGDRVPAGVFAAPSGLLSTPPADHALWARATHDDHSIDNDRLSRGARRSP